MSKAHREFEAAFDKFLGQVGAADAMSVATGLFVSLVVGYLKHHGENANKAITIKGGDQRDITIHPPKGSDHAATQKGP